MAHQITFAQLIAKVQDRTITPDEVRRYFVLDATPLHPTKNSEHVAKHWSLISGRKSHHSHGTEQGCAKAHPILRGGPASSHHY